MISLVASNERWSNLTGQLPYAFSLPTKSDKVPMGSEWLHEIKHNGYRMTVIREQDRVRLISRGGHCQRRFDFGQKPTGSRDTVSHFKTPTRVGYGICNRSLDDHREISCLTKGSPSPDRT
jgi:hypothetical protein